jgi:hypothetical protein
LNESLLEFEAFTGLGGGLNNGEVLELPLVCLELFLVICSNESRNDSEDAVLEEVSNTKNGSSCGVAVGFRGLFFSMLAFLREKKNILRYSKTTPKDDDDQ